MKVDFDSYIRFSSIEKLEIGHLVKDYIVNKAES